MILSASRRTDIPCYYSDWFFNRLKAGYAYTQNPMNLRQIFRIPLTRDVVDCIVFWTKDPSPMIPRLRELDEMGYPYYFQFTLTPYGKDLERNLRRKDEIEDTFRALSMKLGRDRVVWRYDPIIFNDDYSISWHREQFLRLCQRLGNFADTVTISFVDIYPKLRTNAIRSIRQEEMMEMASIIGPIANEYGIQAVSCAESGDFSAFGISRASCIDQHRIEKICGEPMKIPSDKNQRIGCGCCQSVDIGAYNTCLNGCVYCYANISDEAVQRRMFAHDPHGEMLYGYVPDDIPIKTRDAKSHRIDQIQWDF